MKRQWQCIGILAVWIIFNSMQYKNIIYIFETKNGRKSTTRNGLVYIGMQYLLTKNLFIIYDNIDQWIFVYLIKIAYSNMKIQCYLIE